MTEKYFWNEIIIYVICMLLHHFREYYIENDMRIQIFTINVFNYCIQYLFGPSKIKLRKIIRNDSLRFSLRLNKIE